jgi:hypothetical protein
MPLSSTTRLRIRRRHVDDATGWNHGGNTTVCRQATTAPPLRAQSTPTTVQVVPPLSIDPQEGSGKSSLRQQLLEIFSLQAAQAARPSIENRVG